MSLAGGDLENPRTRHLETGSQHPKDEPPAAADQHRPDQRHKGYSTDDYAGSNPWYGQPRSSPVFSLAESFPHTVCGNQGRRHAKREEEELQKPEPDIEKGKSGGGGERAGSGPTGRSRDARLDKEDTSSQEGIAASTSEKTRSETDASRPRSLGTVSKDQSEAEEEEEDEKRQASYARHRNRFARLRARYPDALAEYLATTVTVFLALCGNLSYRVNPSYGAYETLCWTHGLASMAEIYIAGGASGAYKSRYVFSAGSSLTAAGLAYSVYHDAIHRVDPGLTEITGESSYTIPQEHISVSTAFWSEFLAIAALACIVFALGDDQNSPPGAGMNAQIIGLVVTMLGLTLGYNTGPCLNPMRDLATRLVALGAGYGTQTFRNWWWIGGCWGAVLAGAMTGAAVYDVFVFTGGESPVNYLWPSTREMVDKLKSVVKLGHKK